MTNPDPNPMDELEVRRGMQGMAVGIRAFYEGLVDQQFSEVDALRLTMAYVRGLAMSGTGE